VLDWHEARADERGTLQPILFGLVNASKFSSSPKQYNQIKKLFQRTGQKDGPDAEMSLNNGYQNSPLQYANAVYNVLTAANYKIAPISKRLKTHVSAFGDQPPVIEVIAPSFFSLSSLAINLPNQGFNVSTSQYAANVALASLRDLAISNATLQKSLTSATINASIDWKAPTATLVDSLPANTSALVKGMLQLSANVTAGSDVDVSTLSKIVSGSFVSRLAPIPASVKSFVNDAGDAVSTFSNGSYDNTQETMSSIQRDVQSTEGLTETVASLLFPGNASVEKAVTQVSTAATAAVNVAGLAVGIIGGALSFTAGIGEIGAALGPIAGLFGGSGSAQEVQLLQNIQSQIQTLNQHIDQRFDRLEALDNQIIAAIQSLASALANGMTTISSQLSQLQTSIDFTNQLLSLGEIQTAWTKLQNAATNYRSDLSYPDITKNHLDVFVAHAVNESNSWYFNGVVQSPMTADLFSQGIDPKSGTPLPIRIDQRFGALVQVCLSQSDSTYNTRNFVEWARGANSYCDAIVQSTTQIDHNSVVANVQSLWNAGIGFRSCFEALFDPSAVDSQISSVKLLFGVPQNGDAINIDDFGSNSFLARLYTVMAVQETQAKALTNFSLQSTLPFLHQNIPIPNNIPHGGSSYSAGTSSFFVALSSGDEDPLEAAMRLGYITATESKLNINGFPLIECLLQVSAGTQKGIWLADGISKTMYIEPSMTFFGLKQSVEFVDQGAGPSLPSFFKNGVDPTPILDTAADVVWQLRDFPSFIGSLAASLDTAGDLTDLIPELRVIDALATLANMFLSETRPSDGAPTNPNWLAAKDLSVRPWLYETGVCTNEAGIRNGLKANSNKLMATPPPRSSDAALWICNGFAKAFSLQMDNASAQIKAAANVQNPIAESAVQNIATLAQIYRIALPPMS